MDYRSNGDIFVRRDLSYLVVVAKCHSDAQSESVGVGSEGVHSVHGFDYIQSHTYIGITTTHCIEKI